MSSFTVNPVLDRELRQRSRSLRSLIILTLFLGLLAGVMFLAYEGNRASNQFAFDPIAALTRNTGRSMFEWVLAAELILLLFLVPGLSAGSIAGERDRQTLVPLQVTMLGPVQIFVGKVLASSVFLLLLVVGSAPILTVPYLIGGISLSQVLLSLATLLTIGFLMAVIGVGCSSLFRRTQTATLAAYAVVLALTLGTVILLGVVAIFENARNPDEFVEPRIEALYLNPFLAVADAAGETGRSQSGPFSPIKQVILESQLDNEDVWFEGNVAIDGRTGQVVEPPGTGFLPIWVRSLLSIGLVAAVFGIIGVRRLRAPQRELSV
ncbi:MAG: ABC transporter permease subunit [Actinomycetota bacterium]